MSSWIGRLHVPRSDAVLALVLTAAGLVQALAFPFADPGIGELYVLGSTLPLAFRRRWPVEAAAVSSAFWLIPLHGYPVLGFVAVVLQFYAVGLHGSPRAAVWAVTAWGCVTGVVGTLLGPEVPVAAVGSALVVVAPVVAGLIVRHQRQQNQALRQLAAELEAEKRKVLEAAVSEERARIAQELHDVLGHELTLIAVQAEAASAALRLAPERAVTPVERIRRTAHQTLRDIRTTLDIVAPPADRTDATLDGLTELARRASDAGIATSLELTGRPCDGQTPVWLAIHRIVRECLTNAGRHAPGRPVSVGVHWTPDAVTVVSTNPTDARPASAPGRGLAGIRHRTEILGGDFAAAVRDGCFEVRVTLPLAGAGRTG